MKNSLQKVAIRYGKIYIAANEQKGKENIISSVTATVAVNIAQLGYTFSEELLHTLNNVNPTYVLSIFETIKEIKGVNKNWTPLVKNWEIPTNETFFDHLRTFFNNTLSINSGTRLQCGHYIPKNTFHLERYNGCPFCGTPFVAGGIEYIGQGSNLIELNLCDEADMKKYLADLLTSKTALDATQIDSLKILLENFELPDALIEMKETSIVVADIFIKNGKENEVAKFLKTPTDIMRYLWYKKTGKLQIVSPNALIAKKMENENRDSSGSYDYILNKLLAKDDYRLKYNRAECKMIAGWMNALPQDVNTICEIMHAKRGMWVRFIRALRLSEYAKRKGFEKLSTILDTFYNKTYIVWQGEVNSSKLKLDSKNTFALLKQRPGLFARSLFSTMLWFGADETLAAFAEVAHLVPMRLIISLNMYAKFYFEKNTVRVVKVNAMNKRISANRLLDLYSNEQLQTMQAKIEEMSLQAIAQRFAKQKNSKKTIYIAPALYHIPLAIGDRTDMIQDMPSILMGTRFPIQGSNIRLFMQWGTGLSARHLDMDLSCHIAYDTKSAICAYYSLSPYGCKHSGDIRAIPNQIGTAEYIEIDIDLLAKAKANYVTFTCNAYSTGSLSPNMVVGWMDSANPMKISQRNGVAYDPSCVQHQIRITAGLSKGLVFGVLDIAAKEIVWLEMPFSGMTIAQLNQNNVMAMLSKLNVKMTIGNILELKAKSQNMTMISNPEADECYDENWVKNTANVTQLLID